MVGKGSKRSWKRREGKSGARARGRMRRKGRARKGRRGEWGENSKSGVRASYFNILSALRGITHTTSGRPIFETDHKRRSAASFLGKRNERTEYARTLHKKSRLDRKRTDLLVKNYARSRRRICSRRDVAREKWQKLIKRRTIGSARIFKAIAFR